MSHSTIDLIPRSTKSSSNLRRIGEPSTKKHFTMIPKPSEQLTRPKFRQIQSQNSIRPQQQGINELDSKYNVYKHGSPNYFSYSIESHKAQNLKNEILTLDLPFIDGVIRELNSKNSKENNTTNMRDYDMYPNLLKTHQTHKFRDLLSDKQELKDFLKWFQTSCLLIDQKQAPLTKKFQQKQIIISSGFGQIAQQVNKLSKTRSQILKMLWNKETQQVQQIIQHLTSKVIEMEKQHLTALSQVHEQYQQQVDTLKKQNFQLTKKLNDQTFANQAYINTLRCNRKVIKKQQLLVKKLLESTRTVVNDNMNLLDENTKLIMGCSMFMKIEDNGDLLRKKEKHVLNNNVRQSQTSQTEEKKYEINFSQARLLMYRRLQIAEKRIFTSNTITSLKKTLIPQIQEKSKIEVANSPLLPFELEEKKQSLFHYLMHRFEQNPYQKLYLSDDFCHQDDHNLDTCEIEDAIKRIMNSKEIELYFKNEEKIKTVQQLNSIQMNAGKTMGQQ